MTRYFCDICGKEDATILEMGLRPVNKDIRHLFVTQSWEGDLCEDCRKKLKKLLKEAEKRHELPTF